MSSSEWQTVFPAYTADSPEYDLNLSEQEFVAREYKNKRPPLSSVDVFLPDELRLHLYRPFKSHPNLPGPRKCDLTVPVVYRKKYLECKNPHPRDSRIIAVEEPHTYFLDDTCEDICSSTQFVHAFFPSFDSVGTAKKTSLSKGFLNFRHRPSHKYHGCNNYEDILKKWEHLRDLGTELHDNIESFINNEEFTLHEENKGPFAKFLEFYGDKNFWTFEHFRTEWAVFDEETRICGKIDYVGIDPETGFLIILDWKRVEVIPDISFSRMMKQPAEKGSGPCSQMDNCKYMTYSLQLNTYKWIIEKCYGMFVSKMFLIQVHPKVKNVCVFKVPNMQREVIQMAACRKAAMNNGEKLDLLTI